jgi:hypothetical protein
VVTYVPAASSVQKQGMHHLCLLHRDPPWTNGALATATEPEHYHCRLAEPLGCGSGKLAFTHGAPKVEPSPTFPQHVITFQPPLPGLMSVTWNRARTSIDPS